MSKLQYFLFIGLILSLSFGDISLASTLLEIEKITIGEETINIKSTQLI